MTFPVCACVFLCAVRELARVALRVPFPPSAVLPASVAVRQAHEAQHPWHIPEPTLRQETSCGAES